MARRALYVDCHLCMPEMLVWHPDSTLVCAVRADRLVIRKAKSRRDLLAASAVSETFLIAHSSFGAFSLITINAPFRPRWRDARRFSAIVSLKSIIAMTLGISFDNQKPGGLLSRCSSIHRGRFLLCCARSGFVARIDIDQKLRGAIRTNREAIPVTETTGSER